MQAKRRGDTKCNLKPIEYELKNPGLMTDFAANKNGVASFVHADERLKKRGRGYTVDI